jgi:hypothetical protein
MERRVAGSGESRRQAREKLGRKEGLVETLLEPGDAEAKDLIR